MNYPFIFDSFDVLIIDEAHRLKQKGAFQYKGENQVEDMIKTAKTSIFFIDDTLGLAKIYSFGICLFYNFCNAVRVSILLDNSFFQGICLIFLHHGYVVLLHPSYLSLCSWNSY
jgi:hypothetical protein